jgi:hypothetical protein
MPRGVGHPAENQRKTTKHLKHRHKLRDTAPTWEGFGIKATTVSWLHFDEKSAILGVWVAPGAPEILAKGRGRSPPPFGRVSRAPGAAQTPKMTDFRPLQHLKFPPKVQPRFGLNAITVLRSVGRDRSGTASASSLESIDPHIRPGSRLKELLAGRKPGGLF